MLYDTVLFALRAYKVVGLRRLRTKFSEFVNQTIEILTLEANFLPTLNQLLCIEARVILILV
jgi:hypothetical protein